MLRRGRRGWDVAELQFLLRRSGIFVAIDGDFGPVTQAAVVGTSSLRRVVLLRAIRPDLKIEPLRGNLDTRLRKLDEGGYDAIVLCRSPGYTPASADVIYDLIRQEFIDKVA